MYRMVDVLQEVEHEGDQFHTQSYNSGMTSSAAGGAHHQPTVPPVRPPPEQQYGPPCWHEVVVKTMLHPVDGT